MGTAMFVFPGIMTLSGCMAALFAVAAILAAVVSISVTTSALCGSTVLTVSLLWVGLYSLGFAMTFLPTHFMTPDRLIDALPGVLKGIYDRDEYWRLIKWSLVSACISALIGMVGFSRADV
jgi:hypothetical protein